MDEKSNNSLSMTLGTPNYKSKKTWNEKYGNSLKMFFPLRCGTKSDSDTLQNNNVGCISFLSANWMNKIMWKAARKGVKVDDIDKIGKPDGVDTNYERLLRLWTGEIDKYGPKKASLHRTVLKFNILWLCVAGLMMSLTCIFSYVGLAWIFEQILHFVSDLQQPLWHGIVLVTGLSLCQLIKTLTFSSLWIVGATAGVRTYGALQVLIYEKALNMKYGNEKHTAEVINHSTSDIERIFQGVQLSSLALGAPIMWTLNAVYCYLLLGPWSLLGNFVLLLYCPIMILVATLTSKLRVSAALIADKRLRLINQALSSIKLIKMYAWEETFSMHIGGVRQQEEKIRKRAVFIQSIGWTMGYITLMVASMSTLFGYVLTGNDLTPSQGFALMAVYSALLFPINTTPRAVKAISESIVGCQRIQKMLLLEDSNLPENSDNDDGLHSVKIIEADVTWDEVTEEHDSVKEQCHKMDIITQKNDTNTSSMTLYNSNMTINTNNNNSVENIQSLPKHILHQINLLVKKGDLIGICGNVGSGKSSLLSSICGSTNLLSGKVFVQGSIALVTQQAWIFNATAKENITFGLSYNEKRYNLIVKTCCLETDFKLMPNGDKSEIGEKGANLSGGQKQRISLARALYSNRDIYLLDDPLSAVDDKVAEHIFQHGIKSNLCDKTVLLVTHATHLLKLCDYIVVMENGEISERGVHQDLINCGGQYAQMVQKDTDQRVEKTNKNEMEKDQVKHTVSKNGDDDSKESMIKAEVDLHNSLTWKTWLYYCIMCGGYVISFLAFFSIVLFDLAMMFNIIWLQIWIDQEFQQNCHYSENFTNPSINLTSVMNLDATDNKKSGTWLNLSANMYILIYGLSAIFVILFGVIKGLALQKVMLTGSSALHKTMFMKVLRSPMNFFDVTPLGRIVNRFSKDMDELDGSIPYTMDFVAQSTILIIFQFLLVGVLYPWYFLGLLVIFIALVTYDYYLNGAVCEIKRIENLLRPPLLGHISATMQGLSIIRCFKKKTMFSEKFRNLVDRYLAGYLIFQISSKWLAFRAEMLSWLILTGTAFLVTLSRDEASMTIAGLAMVQIFRICDHISVIMRWKSELSAQLISIERITDYCKDLPEEAPAVIEENCPKQEWPAHGCISFQNVYLRYRPELPAVLQGLTFDIQGGEKIGIIGRTGAGKSSLIGALLRLTEISDGKITIDDVDISQIGLRALRSKIAVIPQEPVLFEGTIRSNLDPFGTLTDETIWEALDKAHLKNKIAIQPLQLETGLNAEGEMFSLGEKQLFCLARALLKNSRILLLDEATASVDTDTDQLIQKTIRDAFSHCTVLTIAHRLNTILDYDKIMVMDAGKVVEFDIPLNVFSKESLQSQCWK